MKLFFKLIQHLLLVVKLLIPIRFIKALVHKQEKSGNMFKTKSEVDRHVGRILMRVKNESDVRETGHI